MEKIARIGIVGGGLAGMSAALTLASRGLDVELFEGADMLGGRAAIIHDSATGEEINDFLPVSFGCDTNFVQLCQQLGASKSFERLTRLHFFGPDGRRSDLYSIPGLPAPLHLAVSVLRLGFLSFKERWSIIKAMRDLAAPLSDDDADLSVLRWLRLHDQTPRAIDRFWSMLLVGILGERLEHASFAAARRVLIERFLRNRTAFVAAMPTKSLQDAIVEPARMSLEKQGAKIHLASPVRLVLGSSDRCQGVLLDDGATRPFDVVIIAVAWRQLSSLLAEGLRPAISHLSKLDSWPAIPITVVHLWFDRPLTPLSHAIVVAGLAQFVVRRHPRASADVQGSSGFHYQVTTNASIDLGDCAPEDIVEKVCGDIGRIWPNSRDAKVLRSQVAHYPHARFPSTTDCDPWRPSQETSVPNLLLAGDWTRTGLPSTMESAICSGSLAAEAVLRYLGTPANIVAPHLAPDWLARRLFLS